MSEIPLAGLLAIAEQSGAPFPLLKRSGAHKPGTKMGRDSMSVVDGNLKVYGIENLRIAERSVTPRVTIGNTMTICVFIGERAGKIVKADHKL
jgi:choline dehydrogenase-like flavoprotein